MVGFEDCPDLGEEVLLSDWDVSAKGNSMQLARLLLESQEKFVFNKQYLKGLLASSVQALNLFSDSKHHDVLDHHVLQGECIK